MVFSSLLFIFVYLPIVIVIYFAVPFKFRNFVLLLVSLVFYGWGEPVYVALMVLSSVVSYFCSIGVDKYRDNRRRSRFFLILSLSCDLGMLSIFKYLDFIIVNLQHIPAFSGLEPLGIPLPIGISFFTFQTMSYIIDVYFGVNKVQKSLLNLSTYITLFPQLIAGPIIKYKDISAQLAHREHTVNKFAEGITQFTVGLCKKVLIANSIGALFDTYSVMEASMVSTAGAWLAAIAYCFQIYFDFSGYSNMAIGLGKMFGFDFLPNFNYPYISESVTDFWRRWHISLSSWFREYLYIPLGGNRKGKARTVLNLFIVWMATGIWHGASWNYVLWGLFYFVLLFVEKQWLLKWLSKIPRLFRHLYAIPVILIGWVIFSNEDLSRCIEMLKAMFGAGVGWVPYDLFYLREYAVILIFAALGSVPLCKNLFHTLPGKAQGITKNVMVIAGLFLCTATLVDSTYNPFLYFRF